MHQFTKVEMFAFTPPEQSDAMHEYFCDLECEIFDGLGIPYRVIDTATGDLGGPAYRKFDLEAWMPGRGAYLEDATAGAAALDEAVVVAEGTGEPEAIIEAHVRRAELLAGPLNRLEEGIAYARTGLERMRELGLARTAGVALLTYAANALFRKGEWTEAQSAVAEAWDLRPTGAAALDVRLARSRIDIARGNLDDAAADLEAVELLARATTGPRQRLPLLVLFTALALWRRRPEVALAHVEDGFTVVEAGADDILAVAPLVWHATWAWADVVTSGHARRRRRRSGGCATTAPSWPAAVRTRCPPSVRRSRR